MGEVIRLDERLEGTSCNCKAATERAFAELRARDEPVHVALEAATIVYRFHHPEVPPDRALTTVAVWLLEREE